MICFNLSPKKTMTKKWLCEVLARSFFPRGLFIVMLNGLSMRHYTSSNLIVQIMIYGLYALTCTESVSINITMIREMTCTMWHRKFAGVWVCMLVSFVLQDPGFEILRGSSFVWGDKFLIFCKLHPIDFQTGLCHKQLTFALGRLGKLFSHKIQSGFPG